MATDTLVKLDGLVARCQQIANGQAQLVGTAEGVKRDWLRARNRLERTAKRRRESVRGDRVQLLAVEEQVQKELQQLDKKYRSRLEEVQAKQRLLQLDHADLQDELAEVFGDLLRGLDGVTAQGLDDSLERVRQATMKLPLQTLGVSEVFQFFSDVISHAAATDAISLKAFKLLHAFSGGEAIDTFIRRIPRGGLQALRKARSAAMAEGDYDTAEAINSPMCLLTFGGVVRPHELLEEAWLARLEIFYRRGDTVGGLAAVDETKHLCQKYSRFGLLAKVQEWKEKLENLGNRPAKVAPKGLRRLTDRKLLSAIGRDTKSIEPRILYLIYPLEGRDGGVLAYRTREAGPVRARYRREQVIRLAAAAIEASNKGEAILARSDALTAIATQPLLPENATDLGSALALPPKSKAKAKAGKSDRLNTAVKELSQALRDIKAGTLAYNKTAKGYPLKKLPRAEMGPA